MLAATRVLIGRRCGASWVVPTVPVVPLIAVSRGRAAADAWERIAGFVCRRGERRTAPRGLRQQRPGARQQVLDDALPGRQGGENRCGGGAEGPGALGSSSRP